MIIIHEIAPVGHVIRLVMGAESEAMIRTHGNLMVDITPLIPRDKEAPVLVSISKVDSEARTLETINNAGIQPPFYSPMVVMSPVLAPAPQPIPLNKTVKHPAIQVGACHLCNSKDVEIIRVPGEKPICVSCYKIHMGLASKFYDKNRKTDEPKSGI